MDGVSGMERGRSTCGEYGVAMLHEVAAHIRKALLEFGLGECTADLVGEDVANELSRVWGGQMLYVPKGSHDKFRSRRAALWRDFNGFNHAYLAAKYGISMQSVYRIISKMRQSESSRSQMELAV